MTQYFATRLVFASEDCSSKTISQLEPSIASRPVAFSQQQIVWSNRRNTTHAPGTGPYSRGWNNWMLGRSDNYPFEQSNKHHCNLNRRLRVTPSSQVNYKPCNAFAPGERSGGRHVLASKIRSRRIHPRVMWLDGTCNEKEAARVSVRIVRSRWEVSVFDTGIHYAIIVCIIICLCVRLRHHEKLITHIKISTRMNVYVGAKETSLVTSCIV